MRHETLKSFYAAQDAFAAKHGHVIAGDLTDEFSWEPCGCCDSDLGGDRHSAITLAEIPGATKAPFAETKWEGKICTDCLFFHANGDAPDLPSDETEEGANP